MKNTFPGNFIYGFFLPIKAAKLLYNNPGLRRYALLPFIANVIIFTAVLFIVFYWAIPVVDFEQYSPSWAGSAGKWLFRAAKLVLFISVTLTFLFFGFTAIGMVIASPFNDLLSEKVELLLCKEREYANVSYQKWALMTGFSLFESLKIALKQLVVMVIAFPLLLIPIIGFIPMFAASSYFGGLGFFDVALARHFLRSQHRRTVMKDIRWQIFGLGAAMELSLIIPVLGLFVFPLGAVAATILFCNIDWEMRFNRNGIEPPEGFRYPELKGAADY
ncbi:MAG: EI24 domain-containing protein [Planctomycetota bacterium]